VLVLSRPRGAARSAEFRPRPIGDIIAGSMPPASPATPATPPLAPVGRRGVPEETLAIAAIVALGLLSYSNALGGAFVYDDIRQLRDNPDLRALANLLPGWYRGPPNRWFTYVTFALNYRLGGVATGGYHLVNVLVHVANALLVYALVRVTFRTPRLARSTLAPSSRTIGFVAAALFVTHPLESEAVTYLVQRLTSLTATCYLATVVLYARWRLADRDGRPRRETVLGGAAVVAAAVLAMLSKEIAFTLPFAVALYELSFLHGPGRLRLARLAPVLATLPLVPAGALLTRSAGARGLAAIAATTRVDSSLPRLEYATTEIVVVARYLALLFFPAGQTVDHDVTVHRSVLDPAVAGSLALLVALAALAAVLYRLTRPGAPRPMDPAARLAGFGVAWFFLTLAVESSFIPIADLMVEHRAYLPSVGILLAVALALVALARRVAPDHPGRVAMLVALLLAVALAAGTLARNAVWADDLSLWSDAALKAPAKQRPFLNLGTSLSLAGAREQGARALRQAVRLDPTSTYAHAQLGAALLGLGRDAEAEAELREVLRAEPGDPEALFNLAMLLWRTARRDEARPLFARFVEVAPPAYADARRLAAARAAPPK
jgi:tetratricopeptide (TPR) repeat protein